MTEEQQIQKIMDRYHVDRMEAIRILHGIDLLCEAALYAAGELTKQPNEPNHE